jgi:hypothetical protein
MILPGFRSIAPMIGFAFSQAPGQFVTVRTTATIYTTHHKERSQLQTEVSTPRGRGLNSKQLIKRERSLVSTPLPKLMTYFSSFIFSLYVYKQPGGTHSRDP